jgi:hypothetical protein
MPSPSITETNHAARVAPLVRVLLAWEAYPAHDKSPITAASPAGAGRRLCEKSFFDRSQIHTIFTDTQHAGVYDGYIRRGLAVAPNVDPLRGSGAGRSPGRGTSAASGVTAN